MRTTNIASILWYEHVRAVAANEVSVMRGDCDARWRRAMRRGGAVVRSHRRKTDSEPSCEKENDPSSASMNLKTPRTPIGTVATLPKLWHHQRIVKTLAVEDIYADPHKLDSFLDSGEPVEVVRDGRAAAELVPRKVTAEPSGTSKWPAPGAQLGEVTTTLLLPTL